MLSFFFLPHWRQSAQLLWSCYRFRRIVAAEIEFWLSIRLNFGIHFLCDIPVIIPATTKPR